MDCSFYKQLIDDSPKAILCVALLLVNIGCLPFRLEVVGCFPEGDEEVGDLACWRQETLQVDRVVAGVTKASRRDDGRAEPQTSFHTGQVQGGKLREIDDDIYYKTYLITRRPV